MDIYHRSISDLKELSREMLKTFGPEPEPEAHPYTRQSEAFIEATKNVTPYREFVDEVEAMLPEGMKIRHRILHRLFFKSEGFHPIWKNKKNQNLHIFTQTDQERSLCFRLFANGMSQDAGKALMTGWWRKHNLKHDPLFHQLHLAWKATEGQRDKLMYKKQIEKQKKEESSTMNAVIGCFGSEPSTIKAAAEALGLDKKHIKVVVFRAVKAGKLAKVVIDGKEVWGKYVRAANNG